MRVMRGEDALHRPVEDVPGEGAVLVDHRQVVRDGPFEHVRGVDAHVGAHQPRPRDLHVGTRGVGPVLGDLDAQDGSERELRGHQHGLALDRKSTRLNSSHMSISYAVFCLKKKKKSIISLYMWKKKIKKKQ